MKTIKLDTTIVIPKWTTPRRRRWFDLPLPISVAVVTASLIMIAILVAQIQRGAPPVVATPTPALVIVYPTAVPTALPVQPTPDQQVLAELEQLRQRVAELEQQQQAPAPQPVVVERPVIVYQQPAPVEQAAPTPAQEEPPPVNERQAAIQARLANEHAPPADHTVSSPPSATEAEWARQAWIQEHCIGSGASQVCN